MDVSPDLLASTSDDVPSRRVRFSRARVAVAVLAALIGLGGVRLVRHEPGRAVRLAVVPAASPSASEEPSESATPIAAPSASISAAPAPSVIAHSPSPEQPKVYPEFPLPDVRHDPHAFTLGLGVLTRDHTPGARDADYLLIAQVRPHSGGRAWVIGWDFGDGTGVRYAEPTACGVQPWLTPYNSGMGAAQPEAEAGYFGGEATQHYAEPGRYHVRYAIARDCGLPGTLAEFDVDIAPGVTQSPPVVVPRQYYGKFAATLSLAQPPRAGQPTTIVVRLPHGTHEPYGRVTFDAGDAHHQWAAGGNGSDPDHDTVSPYACVGEIDCIRFTVTYDIPGHYVAKMSLLMDPNVDGDYEAEGYGELAIDVVA